MSDAAADRREMSLLAKLSLPEASAPPWSVLTAILTLGALIVCLIVVGPALASIALGAAEVTPALLMLSWALGLALTTAFVLVNRRSSAESWRALRFVRGRLPLPLTLLIGVALALATDLAVSLASGRFVPAREIFGLQPQAAGSVVLAALLLLVLQPLAETLVFQAVLLPSMRWTLGAWRGTLVTSLAATALHFQVYSQVVDPRYDTLWHGFVMPFALALLFCLLKVYTGSSSAVLSGRIGAGLMFLLTALALYGG